MSKGKKDRMVPVGRVALEWIDRYVKEVHGLRLSVPLFYHLGNGNPLQPWFLRYLVAKYRNKARIRKRCFPQNFRHSFAIHLLEGGASIRHIQAMLGHADLRTTQKYTRIVPEELKRAHLRAHPSERGKHRLPQVDPVRFASKRSTMEKQKK
jgi:integrase/recombinase XerD